MARQRHDGAISPGWTLARVSAAMIGLAFLAMGVLGFIPGITVNYELFSVAGAGPTAELFDVFAVSVVHNIIHLALGVAGVVSALIPAPTAAQAFLVPGGGIVLLLAAYGAAALAVSPYANVVPLNGADNWLHLGLGAAMMGLGALSAAVQRMRASQPTAHQ